MAKFTSILEKNGISIDQVIQRGDLHLKDEKNQFDFSIDLYEKI